MVEKPWRLSRLTSEKETAGPKPAIFIGLYCERPQGASVAKPNYKFDKRQRDLAKQKKKEDKLAKKAAKKAAEAGADDAATPPQDGLVPH